MIMYKPMSGQNSAHNSEKSGGTQAASLILLCLLVLFAQSAGLIHIHDDDLLHQHDCEVCIKVGADDEALPAADTVVPWRPVAEPVLESGERFIPPSFLAPRSRAPPLS